jgi:outer membrane protein assembly factor BamA
LGLTLKPNSHVRFGPLIEYEFANFRCSATQGYQEGLGCGEGSASAATRWIDKGETQQVTLKLSTTIDGRDSIVRPRKGYFVEANADFGVGRADLGDENSYRPIRYIKLVGSFSTFAPIAHGATGYISTRVGHIFDVAQDGYVPLFKKFYLGGTSTLRGFGEDQVLPADDPNWPAEAVRPAIAAPSTGGNFVALVRGEIRFRLAADYDGAVFIDAGELLRSPSNFSLNSLALGTGFGIRYATPIGPLMLDLGIRVLDGNRAYESGFWRLFGLHFSIGYF